MAVEKKVMLSIRGTQTDPAGGNNVVEMLTSGKYSVVDGVMRLCYEEAESSGLEGSQTVIEMDGETVSVNRSGDFGANFVFRKGCKYLNVYHTPLGQLEMEAFPTRVKYELREGGGSVDLAYQLNVQGQYMGINQLKVDFWEGNGAGA